MRRSLLPSSLRHASLIQKTSFRCPSLPSLLLCTFFTLFIVSAVSPSTAHADEIAPELEGPDLRVKAHVELKKLVSTLSPTDRGRLIGLYAAFDPSQSDPSAQVACDDDGDYVIVLSDAMLRLIASITRAAIYDESNVATNNNNTNNNTNANTNRVEDYASFLARSQTPGRRLLPPPQGFFSVPSQTAPPSAYEERLSEMLSFVLARELAHLRAGDLACPHPTATKESGDDVWTLSERGRANEIMRAIYPGNQAARDAEATEHMLRATKNATLSSSSSTPPSSEKGAIAFLRFFAQLDAAATPPNANANFNPTYRRLHPAARARLTVVKQSVIDRHAGEFE